MKKILFCLIVLGAFYTNTMAQSQGSISLGGEFFMWFENPKTVNNNQTVDGPKTTQFTLLPSFEYYVMEDLSLGLGIGYDMTRKKGVSGNITTTDKWGVFYFQPYLRKYIKLGDHLNFFGEGNVSLGFGKHVYETSAGNITNSNKYSYSSYSIGLSPGVLYHLSDKVALESTFGFLGYQGSSEETGPDTKNKTNDFGLKLNTSTITFGIRFFIN